MKTVGVFLVVLCFAPLVFLTASAQGVKKQELDAPEGTRKITSFNGGGTYQFAGKVKRIEIGSIDGAVTIDASKLEASEIEITNNINGRSNVLLNATGNVTIGGIIDGRSIVLIKAGGTVTLRGKVDGRSRVRIKARDIVMQGKLDGGPCTQMYFSAKRDFKLEDQVNGMAVLREVKIEDVFKMEGEPFVDDCRQQDPDEVAQFRIPERARKLAQLLSGE